MPIQEGELEIVLEKLPAMLKDSGVLYHQSPTGFQEHFDRRQTIAINEWEQKNKETFNQNKDYPPRKYTSTRKNNIFDPEQDNMLVQKVNGVDRGFPLKPVYHKRFFGDKDEVQIFPVPSVPSLSGGIREHSGEPGKTENRKRQEKSSPSFEDYNHFQDGSQERLPDEQRRIAKEIRKKQIWIQKQLWQTGERLKVQRERGYSGEDTRRREEIDTRRPAGDRYMSEEHRRRHGERGGQPRIQNESLRREETLDCPREERKERNKGRQAEEAPMENWEGGGGRDKETSKRTEWNSDRRSGGRALHHQDRETQRERERGLYQERERGVYQERETERERHRSARLKERERREVEREMNEKVMRLEREKKLMWDVWQKEKVRAEEERRKLAKEKLDWQREKQREGVRDGVREGVRDGVREGVREGVRDGKRREQVLAPHEKIQEIVQQKSAHRGTGSSQSNGRRSSPESSNTSVSNLQSIRLGEDDLCLAETCDEIPLLLPCKICQRHFVADRLDKHHKICEKKSNRKVYDSSKHRAKGTALEEFMKTNSRSKTPELKKKIWRVNAAGGPAQLEPSVHDPNHVTCPHCGRRFAPGPAERHIPKCQNIKSRPPPPPRHR